MSSDDRQPKEYDVYVASSWQNDGELLDRVHKELRDAELTTFDFRELGRWWEKDGTNPWSGDGPSDPPTPFARFYHPARVKAFAFDYAGLSHSRSCLLVLPAGLDSHWEAAWCNGRGLPVVVWGKPRDEYVMMSHTLAQQRGVVLPPSVSLEEAVRLLKAYLTPKEA